MAKFQLATLCASLSLLAVGLAQEVVLSFSRNLTSSHPNLITLRCEGIADSAPVANALFFRNSELFMIPRRQDLENGGVLFAVTWAIEGSYQCAREENTRRSNAKVIMSEH